jgi:hypothetical protein
MQGGQFYVMNRFGDANEFAIFGLHGLIHQNPLPRDCSGALRIQEKETLKPNAGTSSSGCALRASEGPAPPEWPFDQDGNWVSPPTKKARQMLVITFGATTISWAGETRPEEEEETTNAREEFNLSTYPSNNQGTAVRGVYSHSKRATE